MWHVLLAIVFVAVLAATAWAEEPKAAGIRLASPQDYQVFQRSSRTEGTVFLNGRVTVAAKKLEARFTGGSLVGPLDGKWFKVSNDPQTGAFNVAKAVPAGGWYKLEMRATNSSAMVIQANVEHVGVGEVFVTAGQSNSTSCGQIRTKQASGMVASFDGSNWRLSEDPQPGAQDMYLSPNEPVYFGGSPWPSFGDAMFAKYGVPVGVATTGHGGTSVTGWQPGGGLFAWTLTRIKQLGRNGFRAVLWHQGESDRDTDSDEYYKKLANIIRTSNKQAGWTFPWFVAEASYGGVTAPRYENVRAAQERLWKDGVAQQGPDTDALGSEYRDYEGAGGHFSPKGLKAHGEMWAVCVGKYLDKILGK